MGQGMGLTQRAMYVKVLFFTLGGGRDPISVSQPGPVDDVLLLWAVSIRAPTRLPTPGWARPLGGGPRTPASRES